MICWNIDERGDRSKVVPKVLKGEGLVSVVCEHNVISSLGRMGGILRLTA